MNRKKDPYDKTNREWRARVVSEKKTAKYIAVMDEMGVITRATLVSLALEHYSKVVLPNYEG